MPSSAGQREDVLSLCVAFAADLVLPQVLRFGPTSARVTSVACATKKPAHNRSEARFSIILFVVQTRCLLSRERGHLRSAAKRHSAESGGAASSSCRRDNHQAIANVVVVSAAGARSRRQSPAPQARHRFFFSLFHFAKRMQTSIMSYFSRRRPPA